MAVNDGTVRLLIVTQAVDQDDPVLGFFHGWLTGLAQHAQVLTVIGLSVGAHDLPSHVHVHSLGKENKRAPTFVYAMRFLLLAWKLRHDYDAVLVHMNQEYILIAGPVWKLLGKRIFLWRNHYAGSFLTDIAAAFCTKVFCTSTYSYTARYRKTVRMPVGVDLSLFHAESGIVREPRSILFLARMAPSKRPDLFIETLGMLIARGVSFTASVYGSPLSADERYYESLKQRSEELGLHGRVKFHSAVPNRETPGIYRAHEIFVNCSPPGMLDKTIFEAAACGALPLASSEDYPRELSMLTFPYGDTEALAERLEALLALPVEERRALDDTLSVFIKNHSLVSLTRHLMEAIGD